MVTKVIALLVCLVAVKVAAGPKGKDYITGYELDQRLNKLWEKLSALLKRYCGGYGYEKDSGYGGRYPETGYGYDTYPFFYGYGVKAKDKGDRHGKVKDDDDGYGKVKEKGGYGSKKSKRYRKGYEKIVKYPEEKKYPVRGKGYGKPYAPSHPLYRLKNGYYVAFMAHAHNNQSVYDKYTTKGNDDDDGYGDAPCACFPVHKRHDYGGGYHSYVTYKPCRQHYKSSFVDHWKWLPIDKVRVSVYSKWEEKAYWEFNGWGSSSTDFFSEDRLIDSSYEHWKSFTYNIFSVDGHLQRRFFVNHEYAGHCVKDEGLLVVLDGSKKDDDKCSWTKYDCYPVFMHSPGKSYQIWEKVDKEEMKKNDVFVISVTFKYGYNRLPYRKVPKCPEW